MTLLKDNNFKDINIALLSLEADIKNKTINFDNSAINKQLDDINKRIDEINAGSNNSAEINEIRINIDDINNDISNIDNKILDINTNISNISDELETINTDVNSIEQKLSSIFSAENFVEEFNNITQSGIYYWTDTSLNRPTTYGVLLVNNYENDSIIYINQIAYGTDSRIYFRQKISDNEWTSWQTIAYLTDTVERAKGWDMHTLDLSELSTDTFYPTIIETERNFLQVAIHSPQAAGTNIYHQNRIKFSVSTQGWTDTPVSLFISEYARFTDQETTIGCIGCTTSSYFGVIIWLRGGLTYNCYTMNSIATPYILTESTYLRGSTRISVGPAYDGDWNDNVDILFTPDTTISAGSYFSRGLTSTNIKASNKLVIPIGEPAVLEDGCIWIER